MEKLINQIKEYFKQEFGYYPLRIKIDKYGYFAEADDYWCKIENNKVKKHTWKLNRF